MLHRAHSSFKAWSGGMPLWVPILYVAGLVALLKAGDVTGAHAPIIVGAAWCALPIGVLVARYRGAGPITGTQLLPPVFGLVMLTAVTAIGLTFSGEFEPWSLGGLTTGVLVGCGTVALTRIVLEQRAAEH